MKTVEDETLKKIFPVLIKKHLTIATAESCSGGLIAHTLTNISGSSEFFNRGFVTYSNQAKMEVLGVSEHLLKTYGAVSKQVAKAMAEGAKKISHTDIGIATTGISGPTGGSEEKPVGLVFIAVSIKNNTVVKKFNFSGDRLQNKNSTCKSALQMLLDAISNFGD